MKTRVVDRRGLENILAVPLEAPNTARSGDLSTREACFLSPSISAPQKFSRSAPLRHPSWRLSARVEKITIHRIELISRIVGSLSPET